MKIPQHVITEPFKSDVSKKSYHAPYCKWSTTHFIGDSSGRGYPEQCEVDGH